MTRPPQLFFLIFLILLRAATAAEEKPPGLVAETNAGASDNNIITLEEIRRTTTARDKLGLSRIVHLTCRTDGIGGSGTAADPYDASTAAKFDAIMAALHMLFAEQDLNIILGPGVFATNARDTYGPNAGGNFGAQHWLRANWTLQGSGMFATEIRNVNPNGNGVTMLNSTGGTWGGPEEGNVTMSELTLNPQKSAFHDATAHDAIPISGDGMTASGTKTGHAWTTGTQIRITSASDARFNGTYHLTAITADTFSFASKISTTATATVQRSGQWTAVRLNGGNLKLYRVRAIDCGSSTPEVECWPLWLGSGERNVVDECVVEACSGHMSSIAIFPGTHPIIRNSRVDATGCDGSLAISANAGVVANNYIKNASYAIYGDSFANDEGTLIDGNVIENPSQAGIYVRPNDHHRTIIITNNIVKGGAATIGIAVDPLSTNPKGGPDGWLNARDEKIWIDDVTVANNSIGTKQLLLAQVRGAKVVNNTAGSGGFQRTEEPRVTCERNRTIEGGIPLGLHDRRLPAVSPTPTPKLRDTPARDRSRSRPARAR